MSILKIIEYGNPILREKSKEVTKISKKIKTLITDMLDTMYHANGVGLAAPQVGENLRIFVIDVSDPNGPINPLVFVNPKIIKKSGAIASYEGCLSFPKAYTTVRRYKNVMVKALSVIKNPATGIAELAKIMQVDQAISTKTLTTTLDRNWRARGSNSIWNPILSAN